MQNWGMGMLNNAQWNPWILGKKNGEKIQRIPSLKLSKFAPENGGPLEKEIPNLETIAALGANC